MIKVYLDVCCLSRPFDSQVQERIQLETSAILAIIQRCQKGQLILISGDAIEFEIEKLPNIEKQERVKTLLTLATLKVAADPALETRVEELMEMGFKVYDALHIASAEAVQANAMLTTDDKLLRKAVKVQDALTVPVANPVTWLMSIL